MDKHIYNELNSNDQLTVNKNLYFDINANICKNISNSNGALQSSIGVSFHLIPCELYKSMLANDTVLKSIGMYMFTKADTYLLEAIKQSIPLETNSIDASNGTNTTLAVIGIAKTFYDGRKRKPIVNNWRGIPREHHINHAVNHYMNYLLYNKEEDINSFRTRMTMALATEESDGFSYSENNGYIEEEY